MCDLQDMCKGFNPACIGKQPFKCYESPEEEVKQSPQAEQATASSLSALLACTMHAICTLHFDGVVGVAKFDEEHGVWVGKIDQTNDLVTFEAHSFATLKKEFVDAVEDWRETRKNLVTS